MSVELVDVLGGSQRSKVCRVRGDRDTLIVKEFVEPGEGWVRESAALSVMPAAAPTPRLIAEGAVPPIVVMSDVGPGASVADALLGPDPVAAADAVVDWARAIGTLHRATAGLRDAFRDALARRATDRPVPESTLPKDLDDTARTLAWHAKELGVDVPPRAVDELRGLGERLGDTGPAALTPADACPDNNVRTGDGLVLIDFEGAQWRHVAWDLAYLVVPWPSCWCSWLIPTEVADRAIDAYRGQLGSPYLDGSYFDGPAFRDDLAAAAVGWAFQTVAWFLPRALGDDPPFVRPGKAPGKAAGKAAPARRSLVLHRLGQARRSVDLPALAELADRLHGALTARWGALPLRSAPAFARGSGAA